jgi:hypothetical protein
MRTKFSVLLLLGLAFSWVANATTLYPKKAYLQPMVGTNAYILSGTSASEVVGICGVDKNVYIKHWQPSEAQIRIIDEKLNSKLENVEKATGNYELVKLYLGLEADNNDKYVYAFVFPKSKKGITLDFQDDSLVCPRLKSIAEFSLDKLELRMIKPDITEPFKGWQINRKP